MIETIADKSIHQLDLDISSTYHTLDILRARGADRIVYVVEKRLDNLQKARDARYEEARQIFPDDNELDKSGYSDVYLEGYIVRVEDYVDHNPTSELKVNSHRHRITLNVDGVDLYIYSNSWHDEPISEMFSMGEFWEFYCHIIPGENGLNFFTSGI